jgi:hypothetical protein
MNGIKIYVMNGIKIYVYDQARFVGLSDLREEIGPRDFWYYDDRLALAYLMLELKSGNIIATAKSANGFRTLTPKFWRKGGYVYNDFKGDHLVSRGYDILFMADDIDYFISRAKRRLERTGPQRGGRPKTRWDLVRSTATSEHARNPIRTASEGARRIRRLLEESGLSPAPSIHTLRPWLAEFLRDSSAPSIALDEG